MNIFHFLKKQTVNFQKTEKKSKKVDIHRKNFCNLAKNNKKVCRLGYIMCLPMVQCSCIEYVHK